MVTSSMSQAALDRLDRDGQFIVLTDAALVSASLAPSAILGRRALFAAFIARQVTPAAFGLALCCDFLAISESALVPASPSCPLLEAGLVHRIGKRSISFLSSGLEGLSADALAQWGLCDAVVPSGVTSVEWVRSWLGRRSLAALEAAGKLIRFRTSDMMERAEFGRLYAAGEPQRGLRAFLAGERADFPDEIALEKL